MPHDVRVAVPYYKPSRNKTQRVPDYYLHETDQWLKFPHSLEGLTKEEVLNNRPNLAEAMGLNRDWIQAESMHYVSVALLKIIAP